MSDPTQPSPWASPGYTPPQEPAEPTPGYSRPGYASPQPTFGAPGPGYESTARPTQTGTPPGTYTFPSLQKQPVEPLAIASLVTSPIAPLGLGLGIAAHRKIKQTLRRGKGLATAGIIFSSLFLIAGLLTIGTFILDGTFARLSETPVAGDVPATRAGSPVNLDAGNCVVTMPVTPEVGEVTLTPCAQDHQLQVIARTPITASEYEGPEVLHPKAAEVCEAAFNDLSTRIGERAENFVPWHLIPSEANWKAGEKNIICFARSTTGPITVDLVG